MLLNAVSEEAGYHGFSSFGCLSLKKVPFKPPSDNKILVTFLMVDLSCCCPAVCKVFGIYTKVLKDVSIKKQNVLPYSKLLINGVSHHSDKITP